jgi:hypothetical protein
MRFKDPAAKYSADWHRWFAWHPVTVGNQIAWLEWVERKYDQNGGPVDDGGTGYFIAAGGWEYR